ncbi:Leptin receptor [Chelonia mydas]|uniref:Leptin receptor n=1 Tax=Chelonia mydas TaxID=8469 RepID=M7B9Z4_CHEMY|nr:Leptin receptor [Chelonia mydas]
MLLVSVEYWSRRESAQRSIYRVFTGHDKSTSAGSIGPENGSCSVFIVPSSVTHCLHYFFVFPDFIRMAVAHCMVHQIPASSFMLPCPSPNETSVIPLTTGVVASSPGLHGEHGTAETNSLVLVAEESFLCCLWSETHANCSSYTAGMETKKFTFSEISSLTPQQTDLSWNILCWTKGDLELFVCILKLSNKKSYLNGEVKINLSYVLSELSLEDMSTDSLKGNFMVTPCDCNGSDKYECHISSLKLNYTYITWLNIINGVTLLQSPLMSVRPINIAAGAGKLEAVVVGRGSGKQLGAAGTASVFAAASRHRAKAAAPPCSSQLFCCCLSTGANTWELQRRATEVKPEPPLNLRLEMTDEGQLKICWFNPVITPYPLQYEVKFSGNATQNAWQVVEIVTETSLIIGNVLVGSSYLVQVRCKSLHGPGFWSDWSTPYNLNAEDVMYFPPKILTSVGSNVSFHCLYNDKNKMILSKKIVWWLNLAEEIPVRQYTLVNDRVSRVTLFNLNATKPRGKFFYNALYCCNQNRECHHRYAELYVVVSAFAVSQIHLHILDCPSRIGELTSLPTIEQIFEVSNAPTRSAMIKVLDLCVVYIVQVRCSGLDGLGYWSDWSKPAYTIVQDIQAPLRGPEFWRVINEDPIRKQKNVTLVWKLGSWAALAARCVSCGGPRELDSLAAYLVDCRGTGDPRKLSSLIDMLQLSENPLQMSSGKTREPVNIVQSLSAYPVNSSCVILTWTLSPQMYVITSFFLEWKNLNEEEQMKWIRVAPNISKYYIYDHFILIEKYQFSLYPIFPEGVGNPKTTDGFIKVCGPSVSKPVLEHPHCIVNLGLTVSGPRSHSHANAFTLHYADLLTLICSMSCIHTAKKIGLGLESEQDLGSDPLLQQRARTQPETFEHLFIKHPEAISFGPLLLEPEIVLEDINVAKALKSEDKQDLLAVDSMFTKIQDSEHDSACSSSHFSNCLSESSHDDKVSEGITRQSNIKYATIISNCKSSGLCEQQKNLSGSFNGCFLGEDSLVTDPFSRSWEVGNQAFLILPDQHPSQASKTISLSVVSSEGFSEPSDHDDIFSDGGSPERSLYYLGLTSIKKNENEIFLTENSRVMCHLHTNGLFKDMGFLQGTTSDLNPFIKNSLKYENSVKTFVPYMPQFQATTVKLQETTETKT